MHRGVNHIPLLGAGGGVDEPGRGKEEPNGALPVHLDTPSALVTAQHKNLTSLTLTARVLLLRAHRLQVAWPQSY